MQQLKTKWPVEHWSMRFVAAISVSRRDTAVSNYERSVLRALLLVRFNSEQQQQSLVLLEARNVATANHSVIKPAVSSRKL